MVMGPVMVVRSAQPSKGESTRTVTVLGIRIDARAVSAKALSPMVSRPSLSSTEVKLDL